MVRYAWIGSLCLLLFLELHGVYAEDAEPAPADKEDDGVTGKSSDDVMTQDILAMVKSACKGGKIKSFAYPSGSVFSGGCNAEGQRDGEGEVSIEFIIMLLCTQ
jgi:hypothetical protein